MESLFFPEKPDCSNVLFIDNFVRDSSVLIDSTNATTLPILYSYLNSKTQVLEALRSKFVTIDRVGFLFTYGNANLFLDAKHFFVQENVDFMISLIQEFSIQHLDFLACETLSYPVWSKYYDSIRQATGITIGASINKTGNRRFESDWTMENTGENIELVYFTVQVELYKYLLDESDNNDNNGNDKIDDKIIVK